MSQASRAMLGQCLFVERHMPVRSRRIRLTVLALRSFFMNPDMVRT